MLRGFLNNPTFNIARWYKMSIRFDHALVHYRNLVQIEGLHENLRISVYKTLSSCYDENLALNDTKQNHQIYFLNFSTKYLPDFHIEIAKTYLSIARAHEALEILLKYAPSEEKLINDCFKNLAFDAHAVGDFSLEITYSEKNIEFYLKRSDELFFLEALAFTYQRIADAYFANRQTALAVDRLEKAIQSFKASFKLAISPDEPYFHSIQDALNEQIMTCYKRLADIYRDTNNEKAAGDAILKTSTDLIKVDDNATHDTLVRDLVKNRPSISDSEVFDKTLIDGLLLAQLSVEESKIFKCRNGHELCSSSLQPCAWKCDICGREYQHNTPTWFCICSQQNYKCGTCIARELFFYNRDLLDAFLRKAQAGEMASQSDS
jgi:tetratricopeptide (TPR) repeat protein